MLYVQQRALSPKYESVCKNLLGSYRRFFYGVKYSDFEGETRHLKWRELGLPQMHSD